MDSLFLVRFHEKPGVVTGKFRGAWLGLGPTLQSGSGTSPIRGQGQAQSGTSLFRNKQKVILSMHITLTKTYSKSWGELGEVGLLTL